MIKTEVVPLIPIEENTVCLQSIEIRFKQFYGKQRELFSKPFRDYVQILSVKQINQSIHKNKWKTISRTQDIGFYVAKPVYMTGKSTEAPNRRHRLLLKTKTIKFKLQRQTHRSIDLHNSEQMNTDTTQSFLDTITDQSQHEHHKNHTALLHRNPSRRLQTLQNPLLQFHSTRYKIEMKDFCYKRINSLGKNIEWFLLSLNSVYFSQSWRRKLWLLS